MGLGAFPATHRQALGMLGMHGTYEANMTMHNADVISPSGYDLMTERRTIWQSTAQMPLFCISILILLPFLKP